MEYTGADGVMSAISLLKDPALFLREPIGPLLKYPIENVIYYFVLYLFNSLYIQKALIPCQLFKEYLDLVEVYPVRLGIVKVILFNNKYR